MERARASVERRTPVTGFDQNESDLTARGEMCPMMRLGTSRCECVRCLDGIQFNRLTASCVGFKSGCDEFLVCVAGFEHRLLKFRRPRQTRTTLAIHSLSAPGRIKTRQKEAGRLGARRSTDGRDPS
jgi:hypothetical protein